MNNAWKASAGGFWIVFVLTAMRVLYPLSFPPACWICKDMSHPDPRREVVDTFYAPLNWLAPLGNQRQARAAVLNP